MESITKEIKENEFAEHVKLIQETRDHVDKWMTSVTNNFSGSVDAFAAAVIIDVTVTNELTGPLIGFDRKITSLRDYISDARYCETQKALIALQDYVETNFRMIGLRKIVALAMKLKKQLGLCVDEITPPKYEIAIGGDICNIGPSAKLLMRVQNHAPRKGEPCTERSWKSFRKFLRDTINRGDMLEHFYHQDGKIHTSIPVGKLTITEK